MPSSTNPADKNPLPPPPPYAPVAALLSYLVPGLGQMVQGRVGKGLLFLVCLYTLFFYGLFLGRGYAAVTTDDGRVVEFRVSSNVYLPSSADRNPGQPDSGSTLQNLAIDLYNRPQFLGQVWMGVVVWPAIYQYATATPGKPEHPILGDFMRTPEIKALNAVHTGGNKLLELGWVYTVIAGVLNIMVIYDALAGPALLPAPKPSPQPSVPQATQ